MELSIFSADSHVLEPADLWTSRVDRRFRDRAPRVREGDWFVCENLTPFPVAGLGVAGVDPAQYPERMPAGYGAVRPSGWDPIERLKDQEIDGVSGEILYPSLGMLLFGIDDPELRAASFRAYNDWIAEFCRHEPTRLVGVAMLPLDDLAEGVRELERAGRLGLRGAMIWGKPPAKRSYDSPEWDPLWAAAQATGMPLSLHILTEREGSGVREGSVMKRFPSLHHALERSISDLVYGGALARFPGLRIVSAENDVGWIAHFLQRLDHAYHRYRFLEPGPVIPEEPSFYFRRQVYATFQEDRVGIETRAWIGEHNLMWASDFPHSDSTWPRSREVLKRDFADLDEPTARRIAGSNCMRLYGLE